MQRIKDVQLLSDEELAALDTEKQALEKELSPSKKEESLIQKKLAWFKQDEQIKQEISQATETLSLARKQIEEASSRYEYMEKIDASIEIDHRTIKMLFHEVALVL